MDVKGFVKIPLSALTVLGVTTTVLRASHAIPRSNNFGELNKTFVTDFGHYLRGQTVAMGDRSGSFAYFLGGHVFQLEGLVGGMDYFKKVREHKDITHYLCGKHVSILVAYEPYLGKYKDIKVPTLRPQLTQYNGAYIQVKSANEVVHFSNSSIFHSGSADGHNDYIYAWKLGCKDMRSIGASPQD